MTTITNKGIETSARLINNVSPASAFTYIATGTGSTAESVAHTTLASENTSYGAARAAATCSFTSPGTAQWLKLFIFSGTVVIREIGVFNASSSGDMFLRGLLSANQTFGNGDSVQITITTTISRA